MTVERFIELLDDYITANTRFTTLPPSNETKNDYLEARETFTEALEEIVHEIQTTTNQ